MHSRQGLLIVAAGLLGVLLAGCQNRHSHQVGTEPDAPDETGWYRLNRPSAANGVYKPGHVLMVTESTDATERLVTPICCLTDVDAVVVHGIDVSKFEYGIAMPTVSHHTSMSSGVAFLFAWLGVKVEENWKLTDTCDFAIETKSARETALLGNWHLATSNWFEKNPAQVRKGFRYYVVLSTRSAKQIRMTWSQSVEHALGGRAQVDVYLAKASLSGGTVKRETASRFLEVDSPEPLVVYYSVYEFELDASMGAQIIVRPKAEHSFIGILPIEEN